MSFKFLCNNVYSKIALLLISTLFGCITGNDYLDQDRLIDEYYLYKYSDNLYSVKCKLGCDSDKSVEGNFKNIWIGERLLLIKSEESNNSYIYYLFFSKKKDLKCCNNNIFLEIHNISDIDSILNINGLIREDLELKFSSD